MTITCCKNCKSPRLREGIDETEPLLNDINNPIIDSRLLNTDYEISDSENTDEIYTAKQTLIGMVVVAIGTALFCTVGAIVQHHGGSVLQLMLGRYIIQNIISWIVWFSNPCKTKSECQHWYGDNKSYRINIWIRGFLLFCCVFFWWRGLELVPLGDGEAILFLSPITTVIVARILLGEPLPKTFFLTIIITLTGLVFICQPTFIFGGNDYMALSWKGILFLIGTVFAWTGACVLVRTAKKAHWLQLELSASTQSIIFWCPLIIILNRYWFHSNELSGGNWDYSYNTLIIMIVIGCLGFLALMFNVIGYQIGNATKVAWMEYLDLVFAFLYQWLYFNDVPTNWEIIGCCLLLLTCCIHIIEEYYYYIKAKNNNNNNNINNIQKENEGIMNHNLNEIKPLLLSTKNTNKFFKLINGINVFKNNNNNYLDIAQL